MEKMKQTYPIVRPGFFINQPFGDFFVTALPAWALLQTGFSNRLRAELKSDGSYELDGSQRKLLEPRLKAIGNFIDMSGAVFPNTIIIAANIREEDGLVQEEGEGQAIRWAVRDGDSDGVARLLIPGPARLAAIIDGQHRLFGFRFATKPERLEMPLLCAIYFDLPKPYQASLFATVNANQRPVSKSQTYELFGFNVEKEPAEKWTPEKLSVFLTRKLNTDTDSPFYHHIFITAENDFSPSLGDVRQRGDWAVSTATVVEGILKLISSNPKRDAYTMDGPVAYEARDRSVLEPAQDPTRNPFRILYISKNDALIYTGIKNYFKAADRLLLQPAVRNSYIRKTVGIQALFDVACPILSEGVATKDFQVSTFETRLTPASRVSFIDPFFQFSGTGRTRLRTALQLALALKTLEEVAPTERADYVRICSLQ